MFIKKQSTLYLNILEKTKELNNKPELPTAVTRDLGFWQILKLVLYLKIQSLTENYGVLFPKPRVAAKRWRKPLSYTKRKQTA